MGNIKRRRFKSDASDYAIGFWQASKAQPIQAWPIRLSEGPAQGSPQLQDHRQGYVESASESNPRRQIAENINAGGLASASARKGA